jgi:selenide,water dikinase
LAPGELDKVIGKLDCSSDDLIVGIEGSEDATVFRIDDTRALVQTVDLITPVVDDPYLYGQIAAANSLSDIFAMGADVVTAMNIMGFDGCNHPKEVLGEILAGGQSKIAECGGVIAGGHTIETPEMLYGLSVSGFIHPERIYRNNTPREGDVLILTKPLGMGVLTTAIKADKLERSAIPRVAAILSQLNQKASLLMRQFDVHACTDITGFGLAGHAYEMSGGRFTMQFDYGALPFVPEALPLARECIVPGGSYANQAYLEPMTAFEAEQGDDILFYDAQTSGGLLMAVSATDAPKLREALIAEGYAYTTIIGEVLPLQEKALIVR